MTARVVILSDDVGAAGPLERILVEAGAEVALATGLPDAQALATAGHADLFIVDDRGVADLAGACRALRAAAPQIAICAATEEEDPLARLMALDGGADEVLRRSAGPAEIGLRIAALAALHAYREQAAMRRLFDGPEAGGPPRRGRVLVLDADPRSRLRLAEILACETDVTATDRPDAALTGTAEGRFDVALARVEGAEWDGPQVVRHLRRVDPSGRLVVLGLGGGDDPRLLALSGVHDLVRLPLDRCEVLARVRRAYERGCLQRLLSTAAMAAVLPPPSRFAAWSRGSDRRAA